MFLDLKINKVHVLPTCPSSKLVRANFCYFSQQCSLWRTAALEMTTIKSDLGQCFRTGVYSQPRHKTAFGLLWCAGFPNNTSKYIPPQLEQMLNNEVWKAQGEEDLARKNLANAHIKTYIILHIVYFFFSKSSWQTQMDILTCEAHMSTRKKKKHCSVDLLVRGLNKLLLHHKTVELDINSNRTTV